MPIRSDELLDRLARNDDWVLFTLPFGLPFTINKVHAMQYGLFTGTILAFFGSTVSRAVSAVLLVLMLLFSFGISVDGLIGWLDVATSRIGLAPDSSLPSTNMTIAVLTIQHKPHYYWTALLPAYITTAQYLAL